MLPFLLITLHFSQIGFTDDLTFMVNPPFTFVLFLSARIGALFPCSQKYICYYNTGAGKMQAEIFLIFHAFFAIFCRFLQVPIAPSGAAASEDHGLLLISEVHPSRDLPTSSGSPSDF